MKMGVALVVVALVAVVVAVVVAVAARLLYKRRPSGATFAGGAPRSRPGGPALPRVSLVPVSPPHPPPLFPLVLGFLPVQGVPSPPPSLPKCPLPVCLSSSGENEERNERKLGCF